MMVKKYTSLTLAFSGMIMLVTSIILLFGPANHVSHFAPWRFWGLTRHHWGVLHLNSGILFCLAMVLHSCLYQNENITIWISPPVCLCVVDILCLYRRELWASTYGCIS